MEQGRAIRIEVQDVNAVRQAILLLFRPIREPTSFITRRVFFAEKAMLRCQFVLLPCNGKTDRYFGRGR